jgi:hypothetical protein
MIVAGRHNDGATYLMILQIVPTPEDHDEALVLVGSISSEAVAGSRSGRVNDVRIGFRRDHPIVFTRLDG